MDFLIRSKSLLLFPKGSLCTHRSFIISVIVLIGFSAFLLFCFFPLSVAVLYWEVKL